MTRRAPLIPPRPRRDLGEQIVPMINVVFLLLIFFLMTAQIAPPDPFDIRLPEAEAEGEADPDALFLSADGQTAFGALRGSDAIAAAAASPVTLRADARADAAALAQVLAQLAQAGATEVALVTEAAR
ncbi:biopolymer transporter ExbD [Mesobacterium sp. TK19101]|uniref:Biopolymer transporter ExbD n=1 Tax=Mesobacterium hydrothermale TaxID=3111907 RepID=A0ABU6HDM8_9RHOB|nr:biopolymer transporter ExbD [Mesobacterium sp. TK19101]MEC3859975.1 biopolymer transporter ExbD [Mesobacterium sp. TK19101]